MRFERSRIHLAKGNEPDKVARSHLNTEVDHSRFHPGGQYHFVRLFVRFPRVLSHFLNDS